MSTEFSYEIANPGIATVPFVESAMPQRSRKTPREQRGPYSTRRNLINVLLDFWLNN